MTICFRCNSESVDEANFCHVCGSSLETGDAKIVTSSDPLVGRVLADRYRIVSLVGRGGMGVVYKGEHIHMGKPVALKLLSGELAAQKDLIKRFKREADAASRLSNIHTVTIFDYGQSTGLIYLVMEYLEGKDLAATIRREKSFSTMKTMMILAQVCDSLAEAHDLGIIHRDLKPENVFLLTKKHVKDFVKVLDFGLAKIRAGLGAPDETAHGVVLGTPYYMAPEQIRGEEIDHRSDIYSIGALMYTMICGHPPFMAPTPLAVMAMHLTNAVPALDAPKSMLDDEKHMVRSLVQKCMDKKPSNRYSDTHALKEDIIAAAREVASGEFSIPGTISAPPVAADDESTTRTDISAAGMKVEFDRYEMMLRIRRIAYFIVPLLLLAVVGACLFYFFKHLPEQPASMEKEPNNTPVQATLLPEKTALTGQIGKRLSLSESDHDWYQLDITEEGRLLDITLEGLPNMNLMMQVFKEGREKPYASAKSGIKGEGEMIRCLSAPPSSYYILVREDLTLIGSRPTENISDSYVLKASTYPEEPWEIEPNDIPDKATNVSSSWEKKGFLLGAEDVDYFLLSCDSPGGIDVSVKGIKNLPLILSAHNTLGDSIMTVDDQSPTLSVPASVELKNFYLSLSKKKDENPDPHLKAFRHAYTITFQCTVADK